MHKKEITKKRRKRCDECGQLKLDVEKVIDPYKEELTGKKENIYLCDDCYSDRLAEI